ncbi:hypothetical protein M4951_14375 [Blastopirellula sp. J2-11]|uniref:hypothetical protein n=1 Tax=Blastopirellula sp. J2-11 TaxID=2943192 RepID=UPI0021C62E67|nr:hypothetical protein [Blastopirellula sp. J2-11]UUO04577.1 hypothetical protein M4951_14375 [Blastopirellula sp. J2-11]
MSSTRLNIKFNDRQQKSLEQMAEELDTTKAGVLRTALSLLEVAIKERRVGNQISVTKDNEVVKEIIGLD